MSEKPKSAEPQETRRPEAEFSEIEDLYKPLKKIIWEIRPRIEKGEYQLIIGEDASGRVPALIFDYIIRSVYQKKDFSPPETRFFAGTLDATEKVRKEKSESIKQSISSLPNIKHALVITDTISTGKSIEPIIEALHDLKILIDIVSVGILEDQSKLERWLGTNIFYGSYFAPTIYTHRDLAGVKKDPKDLYSKPYKNTPKNFFSREPNVDEKQARQATVNLARKGVENIAQRLMADLKL